MSLIATPQPSQDISHPIRGEDVVGRARRVLAIVARPLVLTAVVLVLWAYVSSVELDSIEARNLTFAKLSQRVQETVYLVTISTVLVIAIAVPLGVLLSRKWARPLTPGVLGVATIGQATPAIGLLVLFTLIFGLGAKITIVTLVLYAVLPVLRNTLVGIQQVDPAIVESARGMGMAAWDVLLRVEMRLAAPVIMAGIRTALILNVGVATIAVFVDAGGLGDIIITGIKLQRDIVLVVGCVLTAVLALLVDWVAAVVEDFVRPRGLG